MSLDLKQLADKLDKSLENETKESLEDWFAKKNPKQQKTTKKMTLLRNPWFMFWVGTMFIITIAMSQIIPAMLNGGTLAFVTGVVLLILYFAFGIPKIVELFQVWNRQR